MNTEVKQRKVNFKRIYYPDTSNKDIYEMNPREFDIYIKACKKDMFRSFNLAKRNYL
jgi:hypothetical protein